MCVCSAEKPLYGRPQRGDDEYSAFQDSGNEAETASRKLPNQQIKLPCVLNLLLRQPMQSVEFKRAPGSLTLDIQHLQVCKSPVRCKKELSLPNKPLYKLENQARATFLSKCFVMFFLLLDAFDIAGGGMQINQSPE